VEVVRRAIAAFIEGDYERLIELSDPQIEYDVSRTSPESRVVHGPEEVRAVLEEWSTHGTSTKWSWSSSSMPEMNGLSR
jgi:ketosteroid isomerase-like protein